MSHLCIIIARFYEAIADELTRGATLHLKEHGHTFDVIEVPGAFEIPAAVRMAIGSGRYKGYVALGCVIRGQTTHYDYICAESARGLNQLSLEHSAALGYGILTVETEAQAWERAAVAQGNKGMWAAQAAMRMIEIKEQMEAK